MAGKQAQEEKNERWKFGTLEKLANDQKSNIGRKKTNTKGSIFLKNLQTIRKQTHEEKTNT
jgi:hypothetical protein